MRRFRHAGQPTRLNRGETDKAKLTGAADLGHHDGDTNFIKQADTVREAERSASGCEGVGPLRDKRANTDAWGIPPLSVEPNREAPVVGARETGSRSSAVVAVVSGRLCSAVALVRGLLR